MASLHIAGQERRVTPAASSILPAGVENLRPDLSGVPPELTVEYLERYAEGMLIGNIVATHLLEEDHAAKIAQAKEQQYFDSKTGLLNSIGLERAYDKLVEDGTSEPAALAFIDIDGFGDLNTAHGHMGVDQLLVVTSQLMALSLRESDVVGRQGGDEFVALLQKADLEQAVEALARMANTVRSIRRSDSVELARDLTLSIGVVPIDPTKSYEETATEANALMRQAKEQGRDQIIAPEATAAA